MKILELVLMSDLVRVGMNEDGEDVIRELWYVEAVGETGRCFRHDASTGKAEAEERLALFILDGGVDPVASRWMETQARYGSEAYLDQEPAIVAAEREHDQERW